MHTIHHTTAPHFQGSTSSSPLVASLTTEREAAASEACYDSPGGSKCSSSKRAVSGCAFAAPQSCRYPAKLFPKSPRRVWKTNTSLIRTVIENDFSRIRLLYWNFALFFFLPSGNFWGFFMAWLVFQRNLSALYTWVLCMCMCVCKEHKFSF